MAIQVLKQINKNLAIVIGSEFIESKTFSPLISNYSSLYKLDGACLEKGKNKLYQRVLDEVNQHMNDAREVFNTLCGGAPAPAPAPAPAFTPIPADEGYRAFNELMARVIREFTGEKLLEEIEKVAREFITKEYGRIPKVHEFQLPDLPKKQFQDFYHKCFDMMLTLMVYNHNNYIYLYGEAGTGKSYIAQQLAQVLQVEFYPQSKVDMSYDLTGFNDAQGHYVPTNFYRAYKDGGVFLLDEMDGSSPEAIITLNNALASDCFTFACGTVKKHDKFYCVATGNTIGTGADEKYSTRNKLDEATRNRFYFFFVDYDRELELNFTGGNTDLVNFAQAFRKACKSIGYNGVFSYRDLTRITQCEKLFPNMSLQELFKMVSFVTLANDEDTRKLLYNELAKRPNKYNESLNY